MFIGSPDFVRRKVLVNSQQKSSNRQNSNSNLHQYGMERALLAEYVHQSLNSHDQDILILQKFRREADQLKRQKWLSKKASSQTPTIHQLKLAKSNKVLVSQQISQQNPQIIDNKSAVQFQTLNKFDKDKSNTNKQQYRSKFQISEYRKLLRQKDKQLELKNKKHKKSKKVIQKMSSVIQELKKQRDDSQQKQLLQIQKIKQLIDDMNVKIIQNRVMFREELLQMRLNMVKDQTKAQNIKQQTNKVRKRLNFNYDKNKQMSVPQEGQKITTPFISYFVETSEKIPRQLSPTNSRHQIAENIVKAKGSHLWIKNKLQNKAFKEK